MIKKYTVKELAQLSGVSGRTLRFYDQIGLLKPAMVGENQYRYYHEPELLQLQQILFFKELGFPLEQIKSILENDEFNQIDALVENRDKLIEKMAHLKTLIKTSKKTINHLRGNILMKDNEFYEGFDASRQQEYENYLVERGLTQKEIDSSWKKVSAFSADDKKTLHNQCHLITKEIAKLIKSGLTPTDKKVQAQIKAHFDWVSHYWTPTQKTYIGLSELYKEHNDFSAFYQSYHPDMVEFLSAAMKFFAKNTLN